MHPGASARRHADDGKGPAVDLNPRSDRIVLATQTPPPESVTDDGCGIAIASLVFVDGEEASTRGAQLQDVKIARRHDGAVDRHGLAIDDDVHRRGWIMPGECVKTLRAIAILEIIRQRQRIRIGRPIGTALTDVNAHRVRSLSDVNLCTTLSLYPSRRRAPVRTTSVVTP